METTRKTYEIEGLERGLHLARHALRLEQLKRAAEYRAEFHCEIRDVEKEKRRIVGYASTSDVDRYEEIVDPSAFKKTMSYFMKNGIVLLNHDARLRVGRPAEYEIDAKGLWFEAEIAKGIHPLDLREQTWSEITEGILKAFSIGFRVMKVETVQDGTDDKKAGAYRKILDLELYEISLVGIPANRKTMFSVGKGLLCGSDSPVDLYRRGYWPETESLGSDGDEHPLDDVMEDRGDEAVRGRVLRLRSTVASLHARA